MATLTSVSVEEKIRNEHGAVTEFPTQIPLFQILSLSFGIVDCNLCDLLFFISILYFPLFKLIFIILRTPMKTTVA